MAKRRATSDGQRGFLVVWVEVADSGELRPDGLRGRAVEAVEDGQGLLPGVPAGTLLPMTYSASPRYATTSNSRSRSPNSRSQRSGRWQHAIAWLSSPMFAVAVPSGVLQAQT